MKELWDPKESVKTNMTKMGVCFDANQAVKITSNKAVFTARAKGLPDSEGEIRDNCADEFKSEVIKRLEAEAAEAKANIKPTFRFPKEQVRWITYCMDKHGDDFKVSSFVKKLVNFARAHKYD